VATIFKKNTSAYKTFRNLYNKTLRSSKKLYYKKSLENNTKNLKKTWEILRSAIDSGGPKRNLIAEIFLN
jgi:hypothetical protein